MGVADYFKFYKIIIMNNVEIIQWCKIVVNYFWKRTSYCEDFVDGKTRDYWKISHS